MLGGPAAVDLAALGVAGLGPVGAALGPGVGPGGDGLGPEGVHAEPGAGQAPARRRLPGHDALHVALERHLVDRPGGGGVGGVLPFQGQHLAPQPTADPAELAELEHLGTLVGAGVGGREGDRPGNRRRGDLLPAPRPAGAVVAPIDTVEVGAHLAGPQRLELSGDPIAPQPAVLLGGDDVDAVELRELHGDVGITDTAGFGAAVVVVEDLAVLPALEGVAEGPELAHAPAVPVPVAGEVDRRAGEGAGRRGPADVHRHDPQERRRADGHRGGQSREAPPEVQLHGPRTRSTAAFGARWDVSAPRKAASPKMAIPPLASAM